MVWRTRLDVDAYVAEGRELVVPLLLCPSCSATMMLWGWYRRDVRVGWIRRLWIRRVRCGPCGRSHGVLPEFVTCGRLDGVEVIGAAVAALSGGAGARTVAVGVGVAHTTVRDWWRRFRVRARLLVGGFSAAMVAVSGTGLWLCADDGSAAVAAIDGFWAAAVRRWPDRVGSRWRLANVVAGSHVLSTNTDPLWATG
jgi:transposase-like protein